MSHNVDTMAYAGEVPWHGLGVPVSNDLTPQEMQQAAGVDWKVEKIPDYNYLKGADGIPVLQPNGRFTLVRETDSQILTHISGDWNECQNDVAFEFFDDFVRKGHMEMHTAGSLQNGKIVWVLAKTKEGFDVQGKDPVEGFFLLTNPHIYGRSISAMMTAIRVVCNNTLDLAHSLKSSASIRINHARPFDPEEVKAALGLSHKGMEGYHERAEFLAKQKATTEQVVQFFSEVFPRAKGKDAEDEDEGEGEAVKYSRAAKLAFEVLDTQPGGEIAAGSWWQAFNSVTYTCDHLLGHNADSRINSAWYGPNRKRKMDAMELALEFAKVS